AELVRGDGVVEALSAENALEWLLAHPECRVVASELAEAAIPPGPQLAIEGLLEAATSSEAIPPPPPPRSALRQSRRAPPPADAPAGLGSPGARLKMITLSGAEQVRRWNDGAKTKLPRFWRSLSVRHRYAALGASALLLVLL